jgi:hypothetical protein
VRRNLRGTTPSILAGFRTPRGVTWVAACASERHASETHGSGVRGVLRQSACVIGRARRLSRGAGCERGGRRYSAISGDGRADVVVDGNDGTEGHLLVLFTEADSIRVFTIQRGPLPPAEQRSGRIGFLALVPRGVIQADTLGDADYETIPIQLEHDAFDTAWWEKASTLFYWRNGGFVKWTTSD